ncbi:RNA methyltransferase [Pseudocolwellia agarivorans]|uniref:RNA methyltransferase n=1 Tax=Pseudocolwellia agarivorans TaxID=1911682 RepID=UPI0009868D3B|nr:RNA methyltransferase [Pseudocolwellia agarivorans]
MANIRLNSKVEVGLINPKSPSNVGAVMRAAGCYQVDKVYYTGKRYENAAKFNTDTKNIKDKIPLIALEDITDAISNDRKMICVDLVEGATPLPYFEHPENALYIFGPEDGTILQPIINKADAVVYIPTVGCMNLAATVNVLLYDRMTKLNDFQLGDGLIKQSRDKNNRTKVV